MTSQVSWIARGQIAAPPADDGAAEVGEDHLLKWEGMVKVTHGLDGTEIKWSVFSGNWASLYFVLEWIETYPGPFTLKYFLLGWFEEQVETAHEARERIETIIAKSDIRLTQRTFIREADPRRKDVPPLLRNALVDRIALPHHSIDCIYDEESEPLSRRSHRKRNSDCQGIRLPPGFLPLYQWAVLRSDGERGLRQSSRHPTASL